MVRTNLQTVTINVVMILSIGAPNLRPVVSDLQPSVTRKCSTVQEWSCAFTDYNQSHSTPGFDKPDGYKVDWPGIIWQKMHPGYTWVKTIVEQWTFEAYRYGDVVQVQILEADLETNVPKGRIDSNNGSVNADNAICADRVVFYDGRDLNVAEILGRPVCGSNDTGRTFISTGRAILMRFEARTDNGGKHRGVSVQFKSLDRGGSKPKEERVDYAMCPGVTVGTLTRSEDSFFRYETPEAYSVVGSGNNMRCQAIIQAQESTDIVNLVFETLYIGDEDMITFYDGNKEDKEKLLYEMDFFKSTLRLDTFSVSSTSHKMLMVIESGAYPFNRFRKVQVFARAIKPEGVVGDGNDDAQQSSEDILKTKVAPALGAVAILLLFIGVYYKTKLRMRRAKANNNNSDDGNRRSTEGNGRGFNPSPTTTVYHVQDQHQHPNNNHHHQQQQHQHIAMHQFNSGSSVVTTTNTVHMAMPPKYEDVVKETQTGNG